MDLYQKEWEERGVMELKTSQNQERDRERLKQKNIETISRQMNYANTLRVGVLLGK